MTELYGLGGAGALVTAGGLLLWRYIKVILNAQDFRLKAQEGRISVLETDNAICNRRVDILVGALRGNGIAIPETVWSLATLRGTDAPRG